MKKFQVRTTDHMCLINVTKQVQKEIGQMGIEDGVCIIFVPHTTAGITINENADPDVVTDLKYLFNKLTPWNDSKYKHFEGNTAAHFNASFMGSSVTVFIENGRLQLGTWQGIYFSEFDGPRNREVWIKVLDNVSKDGDI